MHLGEERGKASDARNGAGNKDPEQLEHGRVKACSPLQLTIFPKESHSEF